MSITLKPWGSEDLFEVNEHYVVKILTMNQGHQCSKQYHQKKKETIYVLSGVLEVKLEDKSLLLTEGNGVTLSPGVVHRMYGVTDCRYLECSTPELEDVVRVEDDYNRA